MARSKWLSSSRLFLLLGIALVIVAIVVFPTRLPLHSQQADEDYYGVGWLFAPIIGIWGVSGLILGLAQSSLPKRKIESYLTPLLIIVCAGLAYGAYMVLMFGIGIVASAGRGEPFWWIYFALTLAPSALALATAVRFYVAKTRLDEMLKKTGIRMGLFAAVCIVPLVYSVALVLFLRLP